MSARVRTSTRTTRVSFDVTSEEAAVICAIVDRAARQGLVKNPEEELSLEMDLTAVHANGCPLDFERIITAPGFDFTHDMCGIMRHIDRRTGKLGGFFHPRFARRTVVA